MWLLCLLGHQEGQKVLQKWGKVLPRVVSSNSWVGSACHCGSASAQQTPSRCRHGLPSLRSPRCVFPHSWGNLPKPHWGLGRMGQLVGLSRGLSVHLPVTAPVQKDQDHSFCVMFGFLIWLSTFKILFGFTCPSLIECSMHLWICLGLHRNRLESYGPQVLLITFSLLKAPKPTS